MNRSSTRDFLAIRERIARARELERAEAEQAICCECGIRVLWNHGEREWVHLRGGCNSDEPRSDA